MNCLNRADAIVHGDRNSAYGEPSENHQCTADIFNAAMRKKYPWWQDIESEDVCWFNVAQKFSREMNSKTPDGLVDIAGYVANVEIIRNGWSVAAIRQERAGGCPEDDTPTETSIEPSSDIVELAASRLDGTAHGVTRPTDEPLADK